MSGATEANVYKIRHCERGEYLLPVDKRDIELLVFDGKPRARSWTPVAMRRLKDFGDGLPVRPVDFPSGSGGGDLPMTDSARKKIGPYLERYGEFLPLRSDEGDFWTFHVTHFVDALDEDASDVLRAPDDPGLVLMINKHVFRPERLTADWMFKLPQSRGRGPFYVTDPFVNMIRASGLTRLEFKRVWPHS
jgi:hypothetical protein